MQFEEAVLILDMVEKNWCLEKLVDLALYFDLVNLEEINTSRTLNFFDVENKKPKNVHIYLAYKELKDRGHKLLTTDRNSPIKSYTVKERYTVKEVKERFKVPNKIFK